MIRVDVVNVSGGDQEIGSSLRLSVRFLAFTLCEWKLIIREPQKWERHFKF